MTWGLLAFCEHDRSVLHAGSSQWKPKVLKPSSVTKRKPNKLLNIRKVKRAVVSARFPKPASVPSHYHFHLTFRHLHLRLSWMAARPDPLTAATLSHQRPFPIICVISSTVCKAKYLWAKLSELQASSFCSGLVRMTDKKKNSSSTFSSAREELYLSWMWRC